MRFRPHYRSYGTVIVTAMLVTFLWSVVDGQAASTSPGLFSAFHRNVWCHSILQLPGKTAEEGRLLIVNHYPGKRLRRVLEDMRFQEGAIPTLLDAERETVCFRSWRDAFLKDMRRAQMIEGYESLIATWPEATFKEAIMTMTFQRNGVEKVRTLLYRQAEQQQREATNP